MSIDVKTAPEDFVYDLATPRRPTEDDTDPYCVDVTPAPLPGQPYANQLNQRGMLIPALGRVSPVAIITVDFDAGDPFVDRLTCCSKVLEIADLTPTDNADGDTTIEWPANTFPTAIADMLAFVCEDGAWLQPTAIAVTNGVRIKTRDNTNTLTDARVQVLIY